MEKHDILHEFPQFKEKAHELKTKDKHFRKIFDEYHEVDHSIHHAENGGMNVSDEHLNELRLKRVYLKDQIYSYLTYN
jgi:hypothetical protein